MSGLGRPGRGSAILLALAIAPALSGCVAAAALPVLAAGGVVKSRADHSATTGTTEPQQARVAIPGERTQAALAAPVDTKTSVYRLTELRQLPPPSGASPRAEGSGWGAFAAYAQEQARIPVVGSERHSAMLADATAMSPETRICSVQPSSVLIDLDPDESHFDLTAASPTDPDLADRLAGLRDAGVTIGWVSNRTADQAGMVRRALKTSGLDPEGEDELVLLRFPEERKQTRREDFAKSHCVLAIAGDEKADFDELFAYLRDPVLALPLDKLIGAGWFIVPPPLTTN